VITGIGGRGGLAGESRVITSGGRGGVEEV